MSPSPQACRQGLLSGPIELSEGGSEMCDLINPPDPRFSRKTQSTTSVETELKITQGSCLT